MLLPTHKGLSYTKYKESSKLIARVCDFVELFVTVNNKMIMKIDERKKSNKKRKRAINVSESLFRSTTHELTKIEKLLKKIRVISLKSTSIQ